jgi:pimeloyl-ACP methyl ester carboxylesterase
MSWQSNTIQANGITLHYTRTGGDKPPFLLTHGFSDDGLCWTPVAEQLAADYDVIMLDARGHGKSDGPEQGYGSLEHAADVAGVIQGLGLEKPLILGHSMGAATALAVAGTYPALPGAILLEDPPAWWAPAPEEATPGPVRRRFGSWVVDLKRKTKEEMIAAQRAQSTWPEAELGPWAESKLRLSFNVLTAEPAAPIDWAALVRRISCPVLLITADPEQGAIVSADGATALQRLLPQTKVEHIPGAGHNIRREQFARYMTVVREFLAGLS